MRGIDLQTNLRKILDMTIGCLPLHKTKRPAEAGRFMQLLDF
jgi:hypothetical protein